MKPGVFYSTFILDNHMKRKILLVAGTILLLTLGTYAYISSYRLINISFQVSSPTFYLYVYNYTNYLEGVGNYTLYLPSATNISVTNNYLNFLRYLPPYPYSINITVIVKVRYAIFYAYKLSFMTSNQSGYLQLTVVGVTNNSQVKNVKVIPVNYNNGEWFNSSVMSSLFSSTFKPVPGNYETVLIFRSNPIPFTLPQKVLAVKINDALTYLNFVS